MTKWLLPALYRIVFSPSLCLWSLAAGVFPENSFAQCSLECNPQSPPLLSRSSLLRSSLSSSSPLQPPIPSSSSSRPLQTLLTNATIIMTNINKNKNNTLNPEITLLNQIYAQKALFKVPKNCNIILLIENDPLPPLALFRKFIRLGSRTLS